MPAVRPPLVACVLLLLAGRAAADPPPYTVVIPTADTAPPSPAAVHSVYAAASDPHTRVYLVNGADPFKWAALDKLAERIRRSGYPRTRYGEVYDIGAFEKEIRETARTDPAARFVLVGYSAGTLAVRSAANRLAREGIPVAMLGYVGGDYLTDTEFTHPAGVGRVVNVTGNGYLLTGRNLFWNGTDLTGASNLRLAGVNHFWLPSHPETYRMLMTGLREVSTGP